MVLCIYHNDFDGKCAAATVGYFEKDVQFHKFNYGYNIPWKKIKQADKVYMVDVTIQPFSEMLKIREMKGDNFIWIDHHKTAIQDMIDSGATFQGIQRVGIDKEDLLMASNKDARFKSAGCDLTWEYFSDEPYPNVVKLLGRFDVWDFDDKDPDNKVAQFQYGMALQNKDPGDEYFWKDLFEEYETEVSDCIVEVGETCKLYQDTMNEQYCRSHSFDVHWQGLNFLACNAMNTNSRLFDCRFDHDIYDAVITFGHTNGKWTFSMYTDKPGIDVGRIAKTYGGGGHVDAAGFKKSDIPFRLPVSMIAGDCP